MRRDAGEVDRIDRGQADLAREFGVGEQRLHDGLGVVEAAFQRDVVDIGMGEVVICSRCTSLTRPFGMHHKDIDVGQPAQRGDGGRAGIAGGGRDDGGAAAALGQRAAEQLAQHLQRDILEGQGGAVEQLQQIAATRRSRPAARSRARRNPA